VNENVYLKMGEEKQGLQLGLYFVKYFFSFVLILFFKFLFFFFFNVQVVQCKKNLAPSTDSVQ